MININHFKIVINANVGNINDKKADVIVRSFEQEFEVKLRQQQNGLDTLFLANPSKKEAVSINSNQIVYQLESDTTVQADFAHIHSQLNRLFDTLLLDDSVDAIVNIVGLIKSPTNNSMKESFEKFPLAPSLSGQFNHLTGVGYRFLIDHPTGIREYKVEPRINDFTSYYIESIANIPQTNINTLISIATESINDFSSDKTEVLKALGIISA